MAVTKANLDLRPKGWMRNDLGMFPLGDYIYVLNCGKRTGLGTWILETWVHFWCFHLFTEPHFHHLQNEELCS